MLKQNQKTDLTWQLNWYSPLPLSIQQLDDRLDQVLMAVALFVLHKDAQVVGVFVIITIGVHPIRIYISFSEKCLVIIPELPIGFYASNIDGEAVLDEHGGLKLVQTLPEPADLEGVRVQYGLVRVEMGPGVHPGLR